MALLKLILDNFIVPGYDEQETIIIDFKELERNHFCERINFGDISRKVSSLIAYVTYPAAMSTYFKIRDESEPCTVKIETSGSSYIRIFTKQKILYEELIRNKPTGMTVVRNEDGIAEISSKDGNTSLPVDTVLLLDQGKDNKFNITNSLERVYTFGDYPAKFSLSGETEEVVDLCNKVIPAAFEGVLQINRFGDAQYEGGVIPARLQGSGYHRVLDIMKCVWLAKKDSSIILMYHDWEVSLHPVLKDWIWRNILEKVSEDRTKEGILLCPKPLRL